MFNKKSILNKIPKTLQYVLGIFIAIVLYILGKKIINTINEKVATNNAANNATTTVLETQQTGVDAIRKQFCIGIYETLKTEISSSFPSSNSIWEQLNLLQNRAEVAFVSLLYKNATGKSLKSKVLEYLTTSTFRLPGTARFYTLPKHVQQQLS